MVLNNTYADEEISAMGWQTKCNLIKNGFSNSCMIFFTIGFNRFPIKLLKVLTIQ